MVNVFKIVFCNLSPDRVEYLLKLSGSFANQSVGLVDVLLVTTAAPLSCDNYQSNYTKLLQRICKNSKIFKLERVENQLTMTTNFKISIKM